MANSDFEFSKKFSTPLFQGPPDASCSAGGVSPTHCDRNFRISDILSIFGAFLAVLIAIEIFLNITLYLRDDIIHVKLVVATALMAIARKVIVFDFKEISYQHVLATSAVVLALGITYWLISKREGREEPRKQ
jgi:uncharacterized membrane protein (DUF373 family)